jgi:signal transduction histidine kinase
MPRETLRLLASLADVHARAASLDLLAKHIGARAVHLRIPHPDKANELLPAPGCAPTLPSSRGWRELFERCAVPGTYHAEVAYPDAATLTPAVAYAFDGITFVFVGAELRQELVDAIELAAPLVAAMLRAEATVVAKTAELELERQNAERAATLARALDLARAEAERATRVKDEFLAMLGHELRNPLAPIVTALQMMRLEGVHTRAQDVLERQVDHVMRLVDDLLDVSRITRGKVELRKAPVEMVEVVTRAIEMSRPLLETRRSKLVVDVPNRGLVVDGDPARLAQIIANLVTNAAKYSDPETEIRVTGSRVGERVRIAVRDRGIGINPSQLEAVFEQFVQMAQGIDRAEGGLGLGLAIVKSLVEMHGGTVRALSEGSGRGSTFEIELPVSHAPPARPQPAAKPAQHAKLSVLIVDDNHDAAELMGEILGAYGHDVRVAYTGPDALALLDSFTPEVAILDIGLPVMDGYELAGRIHSRLPAIRLVAVTGYGQSSDREKTAAAGFHDHLVKPVSIASVTSALDRLTR